MQRLRSGAQGGFCSPSHPTLSTSPAPTRPGRGPGRWQRVWCQHADKESSFCPSSDKPAPRDPARLRGVFSRAAGPAAQTPEGKGVWAAASSAQVEGALCPAPVVLAFGCVAFRKQGGSLCVFSLSKKKKNKETKNTEKHNVREILENIQKKISYKPSGPRVRCCLFCRLCPPAALRLQKPSCFHRVSFLRSPVSTSQWGF